MTAYDRCVAAIAGRPVDRIPAYTPTIACDVASAIVGRPVHTGSPTLWYAIACAYMKGDAAYADFCEDVDQALIDLNEALDIEIIRYGYRRAAKPSRQLDEVTFLYGDPDGAYEVWRYDPGVMNFSLIEKGGPQPDVDDWPEMARKRLAGVEQAVGRVRETAGRWEARMQKRVGDRMMVVAPGGGLSIGLSETALMAALIHPGAVADSLDAQLAVAIATVETLAEKGIRVALGGGDMADKNGTMYSPELFRRLLLPRLTAFSKRCRELGIHYVWRSDGNVWGIGDMLFEEAAIEGYGEVDYDASMTSRALRQKYPNLVLWANASGDLIRRGSEEDVYDHCVEILRGAGPTRHFHGCSNTVLPGSPPENVWAMMRARDDVSADMCCSG